MKRLIISLTLIYTIFCSFDSCNSCYNKSACPNIEIEFEGYSCYKLENENSLIKCATYPNDKKDQEAFYNLEISYLKEVIASFYYAYVNLDEIEFSVPSKKTYKKGDTIKANIKKLTPIDKEIIRAGYTCLYQLYDKSLQYHYLNYNISYIDAENKNICFNSNIFDEELNLMDCGYAEITFPLSSGQNYTLTSCFLIPNRKMPEKVQNIYKKIFIESQIESIKENVMSANDKDYEKVLEKGEILLKRNGIINLVEKNSEKISENKTRNLQSKNKVDYEFVIENKYGKIYKYTSYTGDKPIVISEGNIKEEEKYESIIRINVNKSNFFRLNILFQLILILLL